MIIAVISPWFAEQSTYVETSLPRALARLGHDVHLITSGLQPNHESPVYDLVYAPAFGPRMRELGVQTIHGVTVHRLPHRMVAGYVSLVGLVSVLAELKPDVVQTATVISWMTFVCAALRIPLGFRLFTGAHQAAELAFTTRGLSKQSAAVRSVTTLARWLPGRMVSLVADECYAVTADAAEVAIELYGYQSRKVVILPLGVDDGWFHVPNQQTYDDERRSYRSRLGIADHEVVCIYTGRFAAFKNPVLLAQAVAHLRAEGLPFRSLFVGGGDLDEQIRSCDGAIVQPFVGAQDLARFYWASDIAVWPRSYSASQVEAVACGLPLVMSDVSQKEELHDVSVKYREDDLDSLLHVLRGLLSQSHRRALGLRGAAIVKDTLSWDVIARRRVQDYSAASKRT